MWLQTNVSSKPLSVEYSGLIIIPDSNYPWTTGDGGSRLFGTSRPNRHFRRSLDWPEPSCRLCMDLTASQCNISACLPQSPLPQTINPGEWKLYFFLVAVL